MFDDFKGYKTPTVEKINSKVTTATYYPNDTKEDIIVGIKVKDNTIIYLYNNTLIKITNSTILKLLNTLPKIKNKRVSRKRRKKIVK